MGYLEGRKRLDLEQYKLWMFDALYVGTVFIKEGVYDRGEVWNG